VSILDQADRGSHRDRGTVRDLGGLWHAVPVDNELRRTGADPGLDHTHWPQIPVPGHWTPHRPAATGGPYLYRHRFETDDLGQEPATRYWLQFDGIMSSAEVWLDGRFLGDVIGYFAEHRFEITETVAARSDHLLAVDVACPPGGGRLAENRSNTSLTGAFQTGLFAVDHNPGGIWRPVSIRATGPVAIRHARVLCTEANDRQARLRIRLTLDSIEPTDVSILTRVSRGGVDDSRPGDRYITNQDSDHRAPAADRTVAGLDKTHSLAAGENRLDWEIVIDHPDLWWPASIGDQPLYDLNLSVVHQGVEADQRRVRTGLRQVDMKNFQWSINGHRLFLKAVAYGPTTPFLGELAPERLAGDVELAHQAGFNMMRIFAHISRPEIYRAADRLGVLLWQDLPLIGGYSSKVRRAVKIMIHQAVNQLGHHPSVVAWGGHVLPNGDAIELPTPSAEPAGESAKRMVKRLARHVTPSWNRGVLDAIVGRELRQADRSRPVITRSASLPSPTDPAGSDAFLWFGWRIGRPADFADMVRRWPRLAAFPGGIGSQSVAVGDWPLDSPTWPGSERASFEQYSPRRAYPDGPSWARATRAYQSELLETHIQILRRLKYRPTGGFCLFALVDNHPDGGFGLIDTERRPKPAWERVHAALRPVVVLLEPLPATVVPGQSLTAAVHVVNDLAGDLGPATMTAEVLAESDAETPVPLWCRRWAGSIEGDSCQKVADLELIVPDRYGPLLVRVRLETAQAGMPLTVTATYRTIAIPRAESLTA